MASGRIFPLIALSLALAGCATSGRDFPRPSAEALKLGETTTADLVQKLGPPLAQEVNTVDPPAPPPNAPEKSPFDVAPEHGVATIYRYFFSGPAAPAVGGESGARQAVFVLWNGKLVGYSYVSNFKADNTNFLEDRMASIVKGKTTEDEVIALLGKSTGSAIFPLILDKADRKEVYQYVDSNRQTLQTSSKLLEILYGPGNIVRDYHFASNSRPLPPPQTGGTSVIPIIIPTVRK